MVEDESMLSVVTRRSGPAARLAHDHLVRATRFDWELSFDADTPGDSRFRAEVHVTGLRIDDQDDRAAVQDRLVELGIIEEPFQDIDDEQRDEVRVEMLDEDQLDAAAHPVIVFETDGIGESGDDRFPWAIPLRVELRGREVRVPMVARIVPGTDERMRIEAWGETRFTDFGIEPYSAFLGAVQNRDEFFLYLDLVLET